MRGEPTTIWHGRFENYPLRYQQDDGI